MFGQVPKIYKLYNYITMPTVNKNIEILDPFTTILRFCLLNYKKSGTKISIDSNKIIAQESGYLQGIIRWTNGDQRDDLHKLEIPIKLCLVWYIPNMDSELKFIFKMASKGMMKLQNSYQIGTARLTLQHYVNLINTCLEKEEIISSLSNETDDKNNIIYIKLKDLWSQQQIKILHDLLKHITEEKNKTQRNCYIDATEKILDGKDKQIALLLEKIASGY